MRRSILHIGQILAWADAHHERTGSWPELDSGHVWETADEKWSNIDNCLRSGFRGLRPGASLARLLAKHRGKRNRKALPKYTIAKILQWADSYHARVGRWPRNKDGSIPDSQGESWYAVDVALRNGQRGMPGGSSLARLLSERRCVRNPMNRPRLTVRLILKWADIHFRRTGTWPTETSGPIADSRGDTWMSVAKALRCGRRGLRRSSLFRLLKRNRGIRRHVRQRPLTINQILGWCDEHHERTGKWPKASSGPIVPAPGETWQKINESLRLGKRHLPKGMSVVQLVSQFRGVRSRVNLRLLSERLVGRWARAYRRRNGRWPTRYSGQIPGTGGESWGGVNHALRHGRRGLTGGTSLTRLIATLS